MSEEREVYKDYNTCPAIIDVLLVASDNVAATFALFGRSQIVQQQVVWRSFVPLYTRMAENSINIATRRSDIPAKAFRIRTEPNPTPAINMTGIIADDANGLPNNANLIALRQAYRADVVIVLTDEPLYGNTFGRVAAIGPIDAEAFGVSELDRTFGPRWTLAHEIMHLFGAQHINVPGADCSQAWEFFDQNGLEQRTILGPLGFFDNPRILNFSNPDVDFNGVPTGDPTHDNARTIRNSGCYVADFEASPFWSVQVFVPYEICEETNLYFNLSAHVTPAGVGFPGSAPFTYEWRWNTDGIFSTPQSGTLLGTSANVTAQTPSNVDAMFIKLRVVSNDGQVFEKTSVMNILPIGHEKCDQFMPFIVDYNLNPFGESTERVRLLARPNPSTDRVSLQLNLNDTPASVDVTDVNGKIVYYRKCQNVNGFTIDMTTYPQGIYFITVRSANWIRTVRVVKQ